SGKDVVEGVFIRDGMETEGTSTIGFILNDSGYKTHPVDNKILNCIKRRCIVELFKENNHAYEEVESTKSELLVGYDVFITSTQSEFMPITQIDDEDIGDSEVGKKTKEIYDLLIEYIN